jgi:hypothetical protein
MLFNLEDDPFETTSVAASHPDVVNQLRTLLSASLSDSQSDRDEIITAEEVSDSELIEQLQELGYLAEPGSTTASATPVDD